MLLEQEKTELKFQTKGRGKTVRFVTQERKNRINPKSIKAYEKYLRSYSISKPGTKETTLKVYRSNMMIFLAFILEEWDNFYILDENIFSNDKNNPDRIDMLEVMEDFIYFCQNTLNNNGKAVNTKLSTVSSFYHFNVKRREIETHPFDGRLERVDTSEEKIIAEHFLSQKEVDTIKNELSKVYDENYKGPYDPIDDMLFNIAFDSAGRIRALSQLSWSALGLDKNGTPVFANVREKRGKIVPIPLEDDTYERLLSKYTDWKNSVGVDCDHIFPVLVDGKWQGMSIQSMSSRIKKIGHIIGIGDFRAHSIRKTKLNIFKNNHGIEAAQVLANHADIGTTKRFYTEQEDAADILFSIKQKARKVADVKDLES